MKYRDPHYGEVDLTLIKSFKYEQSATTVEESIYRFPSGDYIIFKKQYPTQFPNNLMETEHYIKKEWAQAIIDQSNE